jgi:Mg-chelatase subunit ChlD
VIRLKSGKLCCIAFLTDGRFTQSAKDRLKGEVKRLRPTGCTDYHGALRLALKEAGNIRDRDVRIIFFTDGCPTTGVTDKRTILEMQKTEMRTRHYCQHFWLW